MTNRLSHLVLIRAARVAAATVAFALLSIATVHAQTTPTIKPSSSAAGTLQLTSVLPRDPAVKVGTLANGLRYYIRKNGKPEKRVELRLVVNAGSVLEDNDQRGIAHFIEHMAFNGTAHFAKNDVVKYLESIGVRFGADLNASTSFDETIYILPVPTDSAGILDKSFQFLSDIATGITFDSAQVVGERGVVLEEWRGNLGAGERIFDKELPIFSGGLTLRRTYSDWTAHRYRIGKPCSAPSLLEKMVSPRLDGSGCRWGHRAGALADDDHEILWRHSKACGRCPAPCIARARC